MPGRRCPYFSINCSMVSFEARSARSIRATVLRLCIKACLRFSLRPPVQTSPLRNEMATKPARAACANAGVPNRAQSSISLNAVSSDDRPLNPNDWRRSVSIFSGAISESRRASAARVNSLSAVSRASMSEGYTCVPAYLA